METGKNNELTKISKSQRTRQKKREDISKLAAQMMRIHGYAGVSLKSIAKEMNITEPALYYYFQSKEELLYYITNQTVEESLEQVKKLILEDVPATVKLLRIIKSFAELIIERISMFTTYYQDKNSLSEEWANEISIKERRFLQVICDVIQQGIDNGEFRPTLDPLITAFSMIGAAAWVYKWYNPEGKLTPQEIAEKITDVCLNGCLTDKGRRILEEKR